MIRAFNLFLLNIARLYHSRNLAFFVFLSVSACKNPESPVIQTIWIDGKASAIYLPKSLLKEKAKNSIQQYVKVCRKDDANSTPILGTLKLESNYLFEPLVPFTPGNSYIIFYKQDFIGEFSIPANDNGRLPALLNCYPLADTLPENILKLYLSFSQPMREGVSEQFINLVAENGDTLKDEFLQLQPELWNEDRTVLTIWFDPGRIKRDLQPNKKLGTPLKQSAKYRLVVSSGWKDAHGNSTRETFDKKFTTGPRDSISPDTDNWSIEIPAMNSRAPLTVVANEKLDHYLFAETLHLKQEDGKPVEGTFETDPNERTARFIPSSEWRTGRYILNVDGKLEDLAGNNLNRPFDRDITQTAEPIPKTFHEIRFTIGSKINHRDTREEEK